MFQAPLSARDTTFQICASTSSPPDNEEKNEEVNEDTVL